MPAEGQRPSQQSRLDYRSPEPSPTPFQTTPRTLTGEQPVMPIERPVSNRLIPQTFARIKVIGIGGAGGNAINRMVEMGVDGIEFVSVNTDGQALLNSNANISVRIGDKLTKGLGAGGRPEVGMRAAEESADQIQELVRNTDMVFITAGMGGGTGTGASPVIAKIAKGAGALTVGVVTKPFEFEGTRRRKAADEGINALRESVDALITIPNERLLQLVDPKTPITEAFKTADDVLRQGIGGISDLITKPGVINLDFADVRTIMHNAGSALMAIGYGTGETRTIDAAKEAISSPLLETSIEGATGVLYNITGSSNLTLTETSDAAEIIRAAVDEDAEIIYGTSIDESMGDAVMITLIATGFDDRERVPDFQQHVRRPSRQQQAPSPQRPAYRGGYNDQAPRAPHQSPILPDDEFDEESSIIRFLRER
ncbi:MAG TPA: cell division protein FtsZ [Thermomicrobiales bacterium]|nr:cell division protein FtsZ [Thermomicrobiales bacterium]